jgi:hypothetical protein
MILESAQILSTIANNHFGHQVAYKSTHRNHPCVLWAGKTFENYSWLFRLGKSLCKEYRLRYGKVHASEAVLDFLGELNSCPKLGLTPFALAMPEKYRTSCAVESYRSYYRNEKKSFAKWKNSNIPYWWSAT